MGMKMMRDVLDGMIVEVVGMNVEGALMSVVGNVGMIVARHPMHPPQALLSLMIVYHFL